MNHIEHGIALRACLLDSALQVWKRARCKVGSQPIPGMATCIGLGGSACLIRVSWRDQCDWTWCRREQLPNTGALHPLLTQCTHSASCAQTYPNFQSNCDAVGDQKNQFQNIPCDHVHSSASHRSIVAPFRGVNLQWFMLPPSCFMCL